jgi:prepilin signal peptidase PulO-like enzyme (type II secretory pathway)
MPPSIASAWVEALPWAEACLVGVAFICGAALGSFLNVVAHRVPRGESPVVGGSRCPSCGSGILPRDNVPVLGWLLLRGRCRSCQAAISRRYVLVELTCGGLVAMLAGARLACDPRGLDRMLVHGDGRPLFVFVGQTALLMTLMGWSLLAERGHRVTAATRWLTMAVAVAWSVAAAEPADVLAATGGPWLWLGPRMPPWLMPVVASLVGGGLGWLAGWAGKSAADRDMLTVVGLSLGWQAVVLVAVLTATLRVVAHGTPLARHGLVPATLVAVCICGGRLAAGFRGWLR